jgi:hypothetical protein
MARTSSRLFLSFRILLLLLGALLIVQEPPRSSGQERIPSSRVPPCGCYVCGKLLAVNFPNKAPNCAGILATDACPIEMGAMTPENRRAFCKAIKEQSANRSLDGCLTLRGACEGGDDLPAKCESEAPWFDPSRDCTDAQKPKVAIVNGGVELSFCGILAYRWVDKDPLALTAYASVLEGVVQEQVGSKVCCNKLRDAARTRSPCDPAKDIDCDGIPNQTDTSSTYLDSAVVPQIDIYTIPTPTDVDRFPPGLDPDDADFLPNATARDSKGVGECPCKWQLVTGKLTCSKDGVSDHVYQAEWKCPSTGKTVMTTKRAGAKQECKPEKRTRAEYLPFDSLPPSPEASMQFVLNGRST